jgi:hypothetical protein
MPGITAELGDDGGTIEVPMGLPLELRLPGTGWEQVGSPTPLIAESLEPDGDATVATWTAQGMGTAALRLVAGDRSWEATVVVTEPLMND